VTLIHPSGTFSSGEKDYGEYAMTMRRTLNDEQRARARELRDNATFPERLLWGRLRGGRLNGIKFRRQYSVPPFVVDFYCAAAKLAIELDGNSHAERARHDAERTAFLQSSDIRVLRIANDEVLKDLDAVLELIVRECAKVI